MIPKGKIIAVLERILGRDLVRFLRVMRNDYDFSISFVQNMRKIQGLHAIGKYYGTDKYKATHAFSGQSYLDIFAKYFEPVRKKKISILEK